MTKRSRFSDEVELMDEKRFEVVSDFGSTLASKPAPYAPSSTFKESQYSDFQIVYHYGDSVTRFHLSKFWIDRLGLKPTKEWLKGASVSIGKDDAVAKYKIHPTMFEYFLDTVTQKEPYVFKMQLLPMFVLSNTYGAEDLLAHVVNEIKELAQPEPEILAVMYASNYQKEAMAILDNLTKSIVSSSTDGGDPVFDAEDNVILTKYHEYFVLHGHTFLACYVWNKVIGAKH
jgi:hypothetical protein